MVDKKKDTWKAKITRFFTSFLPIDKNRTGKCVRCGECCKLVYKCSFLRYDKEGKSLCLIYLIRPLVCRKYPRTKSEHITQDSCGYKFE